VLDGWLYNAKSERRFRFERGSWQEQRTAFRGQWGIAQDDEGRLYSNHNSAFLFVDLFPADYLVRHPATDPKLRRHGIGESLATGATVHGVRVSAGVNRAYLADTLRPDGRLQSPTAASGLVVNRADRLGPEARGDVFVPEPAANVVARFRVTIDGLSAGAEQLLEGDPDWGEREFLASTDERFRPVNVAFGPDGALTVVDMYRGVIQHANYVSDHLREYARKHGLERPLDRGRIWRVVPEASPSPPRSPDASRASTAERVALLDDPNGWLRDRAQAWLVHERDPDAVPLLRAAHAFSVHGRLHSLWTLEALGALDEETWAKALADPDAAVRRAALRAGDRSLAQGPTPARMKAVIERLDDPDASVVLQALHSLGEVPIAQRPLDTMLAAAQAAPDDPFVRQAVLSGLAGLEEAAIEASLAAELPQDDAHEAWLGQLASAAVLGAAADGRPLEPFLDSLHALGDEDWRKLALARGAASMLRRPGAVRIELAAAHPLFEAEALAAGTDLSRALRGARRGITWPGDPSPAGARPLTADEESRRAAGAALFEQSCAACHGVDGRGQPGLAPSLVGSPWLLDTDGWPILIVLHGVAGPIRVGDEEWNLAMPGHAHDERFTDDAVAGLLTHARRAWGNAGEPITSAQVAAVRAAHPGRAMPWRSDELLALDLPHRLDRYVGTYEIPVVGFELRIERRADKLFMGVSGQGGMADLTAQSDGTFAVPDPQGGSMVLEFEEEEGGTVTGATMVRGGGDRIPWSRQ
jgi:mono/diheme cytochrome c family protein